MKLFVGYSRDDKAWVNELCRALQEKAHHTVWLDRLAPSDDWWHTILENVEACECFILVTTDKALASIYTQVELQYALALNKPVLSMMLKKCDFPAELSQRGIQQLELTEDIDQTCLKTNEALHRIALKLIHP